MFVFLFLLPAPPTTPPPQTLWPTLNSTEDDNLGNLSQILLRYFSATTHACTQNKGNCEYSNVATSLIVNCKYCKFSILFLCNVDYLKLFLAVYG